MTNGHLRLLALALLLGGLGQPCVPGQVMATPEVALDAGAALSQVPLAAKVAASTPVPRILGWTFSDEIEGKALRHGDMVSLDPGHPEIILFFTVASSFAKTAEFRYRLNDYDPDWTVTRNQSAHYRRLAPGRYRFEVQAKVPGQPWPGQQATLVLEQRPFFYQTWYAYVLVLLVAVAIAAQLLHQRDLLLKGQIGMVLEERNRIASDCHDTLMAGFAAISWQLEATVRMFEDQTADRRHAAQSCELARSMVAHCQAEARRIIWDLRNSEEITDLLSHGIQIAIQSHRLHGKVPTSFKLEGDEVPISPGAVHHLVCISQEAITNAVHHAQATHIEIGLRYEQDVLSLSIRDDGRGFQLSDGALRTGHFGIAVMEERARKLGGALRLTSSAVGTEVTVAAGFRGIRQPLPAQREVLPWIGV